MELLSDAYITLAYMDVSRHKTEKSELPLLSHVVGHRRGGEVVLKVSYV